MFFLNRGLSIVERKSTVDGGGMFPSAQVRQSMTDSDNCLDVLNDVCHLVPPQTWSKKNHSLLRQQGKTNGFLGSPLDPHWNSNRQSGRWIAGPLKTVPGWRWRRKAHHETKAKGKETGSVTIDRCQQNDQWWMFDVPLRGNLPFGTCVRDHYESYVFLRPWTDKGDRGKGDRDRDRSWWSDFVLLSVADIRRDWEHPDEWRVSMFDRRASLRINYSLKTKGFARGSVQN